jgi:two-component system, NarL family, response regulator NreC
MKTTIFLADDHPIVRRGLRAVLEAEPDFTIVGEAGDGLETVRGVEQLQPAVLILDLMLPGLSGLAVLAVVRDRSPNTRVVILSMHKSRAFVAESLKKGALGYVLKESRDEDIVAAVRAVLAGKRFLSPPITQIAIDAYIEQANAGPFDPHEKLTTREREVLQLAAEGKTSAEIGKRLHISQRTVDNHRSQMMQKLGLNGPSDLVRYAMRRGLIPLEELV